jgi:cysteine dioxygenase
MEEYNSKATDWSKYAIFDQSRAYTRNLVDDGNGKVVFSSFIDRRYSSRHCCCRRRRHRCDVDTDISFSPLQFNLMILAWTKGQKRYIFASFSFWFPLSYKRGISFCIVCLMLVFSFVPLRCLSPIHDHSGSHCIMKILDGELQETQYEWPSMSGGNAAPSSDITEAIDHADPLSDDQNKNSPLVVTQQTVLRPNEVAYINGMTLSCCAPFPLLRGTGVFELMLLTLC